MKVLGFLEQVTAAALLVVAVTFLGVGLSSTAH
jgi:hypothetical protein